MTVRAIRGATTIDHDTKRHLHERTEELVTAMLEANHLSTDALISVLFTCTPDIRSDFPAAAARALGMGDVPLMCACEMDVEGALPQVVRVMMHAHLDVPRPEVSHVYLHGATALRQDLAQ